MYKTIYWVPAVNLLHRFANEVSNSFFIDKDEVIDLTVIEDSNYVIATQWLGASVTFLARFVNSGLLNDDPEVNYPEVWAKYQELITGPFSRVYQGKYTYPLWMTPPIQPLFQIRKRLEPLSYLSLEAVVNDISIDMSN